MPPYKFVKNQNSNSKIGYLSKDVKVINDLIDDLSKLQSSGADNEKGKQSFEYNRNVMFYFHVKFRSS